jgi:hypothetical protein
LGAQRRDALDLAHSRVDGSIVGVRRRDAEQLQLIRAQQQVDERPRVAERTLLSTTGGRRVTTKLCVGIEDDPGPPAKL